MTLLLLMLSLNPLNTAEVAHTRGGGSGKRYKLPYAPPRTLRSPVFTLRSQASTLRCTVLPFGARAPPFGVAMSLTLQINAIYSVTTDPWPTVAAEQPAAADEDAITPETFSEAEEGDVFAFEDRNFLWDEWPGRCVFVVLGDDCISSTPRAPGSTSPRALSLMACSSLRAATVSLTTGAMAMESSPSEQQRRKTQPVGHHHTAHGVPSVCQRAGRPA